MAVLPPVPGIINHPWDLVIMVSVGGYTNGWYWYFVAVVLGGLSIGLDSKKSTLQWALEAFAALVVVGCALMVAVRPIYAIAK